MLTIIFSFFFACSGFRPNLYNTTCQDEDLALKCDSFCYTDFLTCKDDCEDSSCERNCLADYTECYEQCPCFRKCPNGCDDCPNSICSCKNPELNNPFYQQCINEAMYNAKHCVKNCTASPSCYNKCFNSFDLESEMCPCNSRCPRGCPCDDGYNCQGFYMLLSQYSTKNTYILSADGHFKENRYFSTPHANFLNYAGHAILNGEVFLFGGSQNRYKIGKISGCELIDTGKRLINSFGTDYGATVTIPEVKDEVVICAGASSADKCEGFDGETSFSLSNLMVKHEFACMATYQTQAVIVAGGNTNTVELLAVTGWQNEPVFPGGTVKRLSCVSVGDGLITTGGYTEETSSHLKNVYLFRDERWTVAGQLQNNFNYHSMLFHENYFIAFGGNDFYAVERAEWNGEAVVSSETFFTHEGSQHRPIIFETTPDTCKEFCSEDYCYIM
ncbi:Oidioi.mRNA.OKI2018_I69.PAR.g8904.t1.cds [Oikopleura dioica]|uniref:Oidioi.mRNA.OKI2018_I69.PAR.g8904.t1.cds n=1 Tax=Oikopleura dioica TaxID=34765 RepID=A0ABN7RI25_OIKDI|nr:Oidioi.mRNA.OKI2018_I69.PAR.g8904.t1.cds [Oikopleura dioica]